MPEQYKMDITFDDRDADKIGKKAAAVVEKATNDALKKSLAVGRRGTAGVGGAGSVSVSAPISITSAPSNVFSPTGSGGNLNFPHLFPRKRTASAAQELAFTPRGYSGRGGSVIPSGSSVGRGSWPWSSPPPMPKGPPPAPPFPNSVHSATWASQTGLSGIQAVAGVAQSKSNASATGINPTTSKADPSSSMLAKAMSALAVAMTGSAQIAKKTYNATKDAGNNAGQWLAGDSKSANAARSVFSGIPGLSAAGSGSMAMLGSAASWMVSQAASTPLSSASGVLDRTGQQVLGSYKSDAVAPGKSWDAGEQNKVIEKQAVFLNNVMNAVRSGAGSHFRSGEETQAQNMGAVFGVTEMSMQDGTKGLARPGAGDAATHAWNKQQPTRTDMAADAIPWFYVNNQKFQDSMQATTGKTSMRTASDEDVTQRKMGLGQIGGGLFASHISDDDNVDRNKSTDTSRFGKPPAKDGNNIKAVHPQAIAIMKHNLDTRMNERLGGMASTAEDIFHSSNTLRFRQDGTQYRPFGSMANNRLLGAENH